VIFTIAEDQLPAVLNKKRVRANLRASEAWNREMEEPLATGHWRRWTMRSIRPPAQVKLRAQFDNVR